MEELTYTMIVEPTGDENGSYFCAYFPDLPGCTTMGTSMEELRENAIEAISLHIQTLKDTGQSIPRPTVLTENVSVKAS